MPESGKDLDLVITERLYGLALELLGDDTETWIKAGSFYSLAESTVYQAKRGKGGQETYQQIIFGHLKLKPKNIDEKFNALRKILLESSKAEEVESLIDSAWHKYGTQEFAARLRILLATYDLEVQYGVRKKRGRPKK